MVGNTAVNKVMNRSPLSPQLQASTVRACSTDVMIWAYESGLVGLRRPVWKLWNPGLQFPEALE